MFLGGLVLMLDLDFFLVIVSVSIGTYELMSVPVQHSPFNFRIIVADFDLLDDGGRGHSLSDVRCRSLGGRTFRFQNYLLLACAGLGCAAAIFVLTGVLLMIAPGAARAALGIAAFLRRQVMAATGTEHGSVVQQAGGGK